jgi:phosphoesterase RecJ-like protein
MDSFRYKQIYDEFLSAEHPVFICDERIDGDSLGAALACVDAMKQHGRQRPPVFVSDKIPEIYQHLPHIDICTSDRGIFSDPQIDLVVVFDCSDRTYITQLVEQISSRPHVINIDHHKTNPLYGDLNLVLSDSPATSEIVYRIYEQNKLIPSKEAAICMLIGLCFDTTAFSNSFTNERALQVASELVLCGVRIQDVIHTLFKNRSVAALRVWGVALERLHHNSEFDCIVTCLTRKDIEKNQIRDEEAEGLSNFLSFVTNTDTLYVLCETPYGDVKVSMRSSVRDVSTIAREQGGGGHKNAAGYLVRGARLICGQDGCWRVEKRVGK